MMPHYGNESGSRQFDRTFFFNFRTATKKYFLKIQHAQAGSEVMGSTIAKSLVLLRMTYLRISKNLAAVNGQKQLSTKIGNGSYLFF